MGSPGAAEVGEEGDIQVRQGFKQEVQSVQGVEAASRAAVKSKTEGEMKSQGQAVSR
jgi:hypothetical protein